jgi:trimethylguanosine synthase
MINKLKVDYVFLSPPWGGIKYKDSDVYSIKELMTPNIYDIIKTSLNISKNIIFYLPRTLILDELFDILSQILNSQNSGSGDRIYLDVHVLKSAKKIKALMIIFGHDIKEVFKKINLFFYLDG